MRDLFSGPLAWRRIDDLSYALVLTLFVIAAYIGGVIYLGWFIFHEIREEMRFQQNYGANWQLMYEQFHGSLSHARVKTAVCLASLVAITGILLWFYRQTTSRKARHHSHS